MGKKKKKMRFLFGFFTFLLLSGAFIVGALYVVVKLFRQINFNPESKAWKAMLERLRNRLRAQAAGLLVPWDAEMLALLSLNRSVTKKPGWFDAPTEGVITTIYQEPVIAYAAQKSGNTGLVLARTSDREFIFRQKGRETEVWVNGQPFGVLVDGALLAAGRGGKLLARLEGPGDGAQIPVLLGNGTGAAISNPARHDKGPNPRALALLRPLDGEEESALLALTVLQILK